MKKGVSKKRIGLIMQERGIPREGCKLYDSKDREIGFLTSGTHSSTLKNGIGLGYVSTDFLKTKWNKIYVDIRGKKLLAKKTKPPFVEANYYRSI